MSTETAGRTRGETYAGRPPSYETTFASSSVRVHLVRGAIGVPLLVAAFALIGVFGPLTLLLAVPAVVLLRGCPTCWALGLTQTRDRVERDSRSTS